jgi:hypothetical protein
MADDAFDFGALLLISVSETGPASVAAAACAIPNLSCRCFDRRVRERVFGLRRRDAGRKSAPEKAVPGYLWSETVRHSERRQEIVLAFVATEDYCACADLDL